MIGVNRMPSRLRLFGLFLYKPWKNLFAIQQNTTFQKDRHQLGLWSFGHLCILNWLQIVSIAEIIGCQHEITRLTGCVWFNSPPPSPSRVQQLQLVKFGSSLPYFSWKSKQNLASICCDQIFTIEKPFLGFFLNYIFLKNRISISGHRSPLPLGYLKLFFLVRSFLYMWRQSKSQEQNFSRTFVKNTTG